MYPGLLPIRLTGGTGGNEGSLSLSLCRCVCLSQSVSCLSISPGLSLSLKCVSLSLSLCASCLCTCLVCQSLSLHIALFLSLCPVCLHFSVCDLSAYLPGLSLICISLHRLSVYLSDLPVSASSYRSVSRSLCLRSCLSLVSAPLSLTVYLHLCLCLCPSARSLTHQTSRGRPSTDTSRTHQGGTA